MCFEYLTVTEVRDEYGDEIADKSDATIQRQIDQMVSAVEDKLGHTFGRALIARSTDSDTVTVTSTGLTIGGDTYLFATYTTLQALVTAVNAAGENYSLELLPKVRSDTPSTLLSACTAVSCGPTAADRAPLCLDAMYCLLSGKPETHIFLPLPISSITSIYEDGLEVESTGYWAVVGEEWIVRKHCSCLTSCGHLRTNWSSAYPGNIAVTYLPAWWGRVPGTISALLLDAFSARAGLAPFQSEDFGNYSYRRQTAAVRTWVESLSGPATRIYAIRYQP